jgi:hypothetical protein
LAKRVRDGITASGGLALEFPVHPIQETGKRPTAALDRNLAYLGLVEVLYGYPLDEAAKVSSLAIDTFLSEDSRIQEVRLVFFSPSDAAAFLKNHSFTE